MSFPPWQSDAPVTHLNRESEVTLCQAWAIGSPGSLYFGLWGKSSAIYPETTVLWEAHPGHRGKPPEENWDWQPTPTGHPEADLPAPIQAAPHVMWRREKLSPTSPAQISESRTNQWLLIFKSLDTTVDNRNMAYQDHGCWAGIVPTRERVLGSSEDSVRKFLWFAPCGFSLLALLGGQLPFLTEGEVLSLYKGPLSLQGSW